MSFFKEQCLTLINSNKFGILDDIANEPASVSKTNNDQWLACVHNENSAQLAFYAIDNCIIFYDEKNNKKSTCDAAIKHENQQLYFIELKDRKSKGWLSKATSQLKSTLVLYRNNEYSLADNIECYVCNPQRPSAPISALSILKKFRKNTGCKLHVNHNIKIQVK